MEDVLPRWTTLYNSVLLCKTLSKTRKLSSNFWMHFFLLYYIQWRRICAESFEQTVFSYHFSIQWRERTVNFVFYFTGFTFWLSIQKQIISPSNQWSVFKEFAELMVGECLEDWSNDVLICHDIFLEPFPCFLESLFLYSNTKTNLWRSFSKILQDCPA